MSSNSETLAQALLILCFLGITTATFTAYQNPVTGYELSIYRGTPVMFWVFSSLALLVSMLLVFSSGNRHVRMGGTFLGGLTMTTIVSLPIIRGYHYIGEGDALSHLGTAKDMNAGLVALTESRYPVVHTLGSVLHDVTGLPIRHSLLILIVLFVVCFFVFVPLVVRELTGNSWTTYISVYTALMLLPLNHVSPSLHIHPTSQALMYAPVFLFVFFVLFKQRISRYSSMFIVVATMFAMLHPQQAANLVLFFGVIALLQIGKDVLRGDWLSRRSAWVLPEVSYYAIFFWLWATNLPVFWRNIERVYMIPFQQTRAADSAVERSVSLTEVGGSLPELFVKMFLVSFVFVLLTALLMVLVIRRLPELELHTLDESIAPDGGTEQMLPLYIYCGLVAVSMIFVTYLLGGISDQYFRHLGMLMVFGTILGTIMIGRAVRSVRRRRSSTTARRTIVLVLVLCTALSLPVVFASPYIYYTSDHVTEMQINGHGTTFEHRDDSILFDDVRSETARYGHAILGTDLPRESFYEERRGGIPDHFVSQSLHQYYVEPTYVTVTEADRVRDPILWRGFRFSHEDFEYLDTQAGINRVQSNGGYDLYLVDAREEPTIDRP